MGKAGQHGVPKGYVSMTNSMFVSVTERVKNKAVREALSRAVRIIESAPCLATRDGEFTYECRVDRPCRVCAWRTEAKQALLEKP